MKMKIVMMALLMFLAVTGINAQRRVVVYHHAPVPVYHKYKHRHYHHNDRYYAYRYPRRYNNYYEVRRYPRRNGYYRSLPPGQAKKMYGHQSARDFAPGHRGKGHHGWDD